MRCARTGPDLTYIDSSALLKLLHDERESADREAWLSARAGVRVVSSELARVEVMRACRRVNADAVPEARALLAALDLIPVTGDVLEHAAELGPGGLRSLDAIHLASALSIGADPSAVIVYDRRLADAALAFGLESLGPGAGRG